MGTLAREKAPRVSLAGYGRFGEKLAGCVDLPATKHSNTEIPAGTLDKRSPPMGDAIAHLFDICIPEVKVIV